MPVTADKMECADVELRLHLLADGELSDDVEQNALRGHVATCASCERSWRRLVDSKRALQALPPDRMPEELLLALDGIGQRELRNERLKTAAAAVIVVVAAALGWLATR